MNTAGARSGAQRRWRHGAAIVSRIGAAVGAGYVCTAAAVALLAAVLPRLTGLVPGEAAVLAAMCGFPAYLAVLLWSFAHDRVWRVWAVLGGLTLACILLRAWLVPLPAASAA